MMKDRRRIEERRLLPRQPQHVKHIPLPHPSDNSNMEKNERGSALVSSLPRSALSHTLTVGAADGYAVEFTLPGLSTCTCHKPQPYTCWEGLIVFSEVLNVPIGRGFSGFACWIYHIVKFRESQDD